MFLLHCVPFILCMCEKLQKCCFFLFFFFSPSTFSSCNNEYAKKCQDVLGEAVDIREDTDYFLEVHCLMIVGVCMFCICQGQDRWSEVLLCCSSHKLNADPLRQQYSGGHFTFSTAHSLCVSLMISDFSDTLLIRLDKEKAWMSADKLVWLKSAK